MQPKPDLVSGLYSGLPSSAAIFGFTSFFMNSITAGRSAASYLKPSDVLGSLGSLGFGILKDPSAALSP